jgi:hypothetical protein
VTAIMVNYVLQLAPLLLVIAWSIWFVIHTKRRMRAVMEQDGLAVAADKETPEAAAAAGASSVDVVPPGKDAGGLPLVHLPSSRQGAGAGSSSHRSEPSDVQVDMTGGSSTSCARLLSGVLGEAGAGSSRGSSGAPPSSPSIAGLKKRGGSGHCDEA